ncbi:peptide chain release factor N(5)-glutamine methyltransferase [Histidinibacterium aquaticum]|uniref:Release factor glutamine methyltransferase n=1 Tax=Histidinibacterium aquaticum TaxID=2613962 RepID=A0A5J5GM93_9RHOB|nr:peptide chain release factor N(5)-glutamine methyltransferase [Histidinibacterium aquaticum]KAA9009379.1 peptide chain release factor N(5)-glutamine methyltransferase [Histidinibacterium aquaticum]
MTPARDVLARATQRLDAAGLPDPGRDARKLLAHVLRVPPDRLTLMLAEPIEEETERAFGALVDRRLRREPVSHLTGRRQFYGRSFIVTPDVLDPRPETETLIEAALAEPFGHVLDLGTGSGCILLTLLAEMAEMGRDEVWGIGVELSDAAFEVAWWNRNAMRLEDRAVLLKGSWFTPLEKALEPGFGGFDLIVSNPPYITRADWSGLEPEVRDHEPPGALVGGDDGLEAYRQILPELPARLAPGGRAMVEIGAAQGAEVAAMMAEAGLGEVRIVQDLDGRDRVVVGKRVAGAA